MSSVDADLLKRVLLHPAKTFMLTSCPDEIERDKNVVVFFTFPGAFEDHHFAITTGVTTKSLNTAKLKAKIYALKSATPNEVMESIKQQLGEDGFKTKNISHAELRETSCIHIIITFIVDLDVVVHARTKPYGEKITAWMNGEVPVDAEFTPI